MRLSLAPLGLLLACALVACGGTFSDAGVALTAQAPELSPLTVAATADGSFEVTGLRFRGCPQRSLSVLLLDGSDPTTETALSSNAAVALDFDRSFDRASDSWVLHVALPPASPRPTLVELWCKACRSAAAGSSSAEFSGLLATHKLPASGEGQAAAGGTVAVMLRGVVLPAPTSETPALTATADAAAATFSVASRRLQQAAGGCAPVTVGGQQYSFASCTTSADAPLALYATVEPSGSGSLLKMAMVVTTSTQWVAFGIPKDSIYMWGASTVIVSPTATGAEVAGYVLPNSYAPGPVNAAKGTLPLTDAKAEASNGELRAVFSVTLPNLTPAAAAAGITYISAIGPMRGAALAEHTITSFGQFALKAAAAAPANPTPLPEAPAAVPATPPATPPTAPPATPPAAEPVAVVGGVPAVAAPAPGAAAAGNACALQLSSGMAVTDFLGCSLISGISNSFWVMWKAEPSPANPAKTLITIGMNATTSGYVALGFPSRPGKMVGATSMVLAACTSGADCTGGARLSQYYLGGERQADVNPDSRLPISNIQAAALPTGQLAGSFTVEVDSPARRRLLQLQAGVNMPLIFAGGRALPDGTPLEHNVYDSLSLPLLSTSASEPVAVDGGGSGPDALIKAHAWLAAIGWGVLVPSGIVMARSFKDRAPLWFHMHRAIQSLGFVMGTVALGLGFAAAEGWQASGKAAIHRNLGVACTVLAFAQFSAIVFRPAKGQKLRRAWELSHAWVGRAAAAVAIANIYYGMLQMWEGDLGVWPWACYTAVLVAIVSVSLIKDGSDWLKMRRGEKPQVVQLSRPSSLAPTPRGPSGAGARADVEAPDHAQAADPKGSNASLKGAVATNGHQRQL